MPAVAGDPGGDDDLAVVEVEELAAIEEDDLSSGELLLVHPRFVLHARLNLGERRRFAAVLGLALKPLHLSLLTVLTDVDLVGWVGGRDDLDVREQSLFGWQV